MELINDQQTLVSRLTLVSATRLAREPSGCRRVEAFKDALHRCFLRVTAVVSSKKFLGHDRVNQPLLEVVIIDSV